MGTTWSSAASSYVGLPSDTIWEILLRASLRSLGKCRILSKEINSRIYESSFLNLHSQRTKTVRGFIAQDYDINNSTFVSTSDIGENSISSSKPPIISFDFLPENLGHTKVIEASTKQGILLCVGTNLADRVYSVCKPCTRQYQIISRHTSLTDFNWPPADYFWLTIPFIGSTVYRSKAHLHFKIVTIRNTLSPLAMEIQVFDSDSWLWKPRKMIKGLLIVSCYERQKLPVSACGARNWFTNKDNILAYNVE
ncbi:uncharacterized protein [Rutidosis leptorrhynchoides]|uniref:uncharacterized protein n=1 Tax=Rutidosis leptorrhynchoides TaxID=125765 RepID=UPI003A98E8E8